MRAHPDAVLVELIIERVQALLEPGALDRHFEVLEPDLQQFVVRQGRPGKFPTRHDATNLAPRTWRYQTQGQPQGQSNPPCKWCHGRPFPTTGQRPDAKASDSG